MCLDSSVGPDEAQPSKALHGHAQHIFNPWCNLNMCEYEHASM